MDSIKKNLFVILLFLLFVNCNSDEVVMSSVDVDQQDQVDDEVSGDTDEEEDEEDEMGDISDSADNTPSTDISLELVANDLEPHPMQDISKPAYLETIVDPSFGTTIRRITNAGDGNIIKPMYSTIQAWNVDESLMILYDQSNGVHQLLDGMNYTFIRNIDDIRPDDIEQIFWDFNNPDFFFYVDAITTDLIKYSVASSSKEIIVNLAMVSNCNGNIGSGNDVQMMSWDSDVIGFRCDNTTAYYYRISTAEVVQFDLQNVNYIAPMPGPSGNRFYHDTEVYDAVGKMTIELNESNGEHSCLGKLADGSDAHFAIAFAAGPQGGCGGNIIAHDLSTGECIPVISEGLGYDYPKTGTHISAVAHRNPGWIAASMIGYEEDGQKLLDQELVLARVEKGNVEVYRIGHHRADENEFDYWGEPHAVISPSGTRVLFGSDWSGVEDGKSVDSYVVELPAFEVTTNL